ncbi:MAG: DNA internalization-related competence protein ComEC/Rec2 [Desulfobacteraceae bacterium]
MNSTSRACIYRPLIPVAVAHILGIALGACRADDGGWVLALALALMAALWLCIHLKRCHWAIWTPLLLCFCGGYISIQPWMKTDPPARHVVHFADKGYWKIEGVVADTPIIKRNRWQFVLKARRLVDKNHSHDVCGRVHVTGRGPWPDPQAGDSVLFRGRLRTIRGFVNPGGFDYERFMKLKGIRTRVYASAKSLKIAAVDQSVGRPHRQDTLREQLALRMDDVLSSHHPDTIGLLKAIILGDRYQIAPKLRTAFNRAGVGHVLAISGLHVGMVAAWSFAAAGWFLACIPLVLKLAWVRKGAALASLGPVLGYGILTGLSPSTQRAVIMVSVFLIGLWVGRRHDWLNTLALAALIILVVYPPALLGISFQLSFTAVLAIIAGANRWKGEKREGKGKKGGADLPFFKKMGHRLLAFVWVSAMAILGTLPLVIHYFNQVSVVGVFTNMVVVPLVGMVVLPAGLTGALALPVSPELSVICWQTAAWGMELIRMTVQYTASWSWSSIQCVTPTGLEIGLYYLLFTFVLFWRKWPYRSTVFAMTLVICFLDAGYWIYQRYGRSDLKVTVVDVGQASANLLELPKGYTVLVDGGGFSDNQIFDVGARIIAPLLWRKKIRTVDLVVLSHANSDHLNGLLYVLKHFNVREVWSNQEPAPTRAYGQWKQLLTITGVRRSPFRQMPRKVIRRGVQLEILSPRADFMQRKPMEPWRDLNNNSLVLRVCYGGVSFLFPGDIMHQAETELVSHLGQPGLKSTILIVPHHGSRSSSTMAFLRAVRPQEAVISAGWQNRFKFPHGIVLKRLRSVGSRIWCTANCGAVEITTTGKSYNIEAFRSLGP